MVSQKVTLRNEQGFHMRPAGNFANAMAKFQSNVTLLLGDHQIDGKSMMNIMAACIKCGSEIQIQCSGPDEQEALQAAVSMIETGLGEL